MPTHKAVHVASAGAALTITDVDTASPPRDLMVIGVKPENLPSARSI